MCLVVCVKLNINSFVSEMQKHQSVCWIIIHRERGWNSEQYRVDRSVKNAADANNAIWKSILLFSETGFFYSFMAKVFGIVNNNNYIMLTLQM